MLKAIEGGKSATETTQIRVTERQIADLELKTLELAEMVIAKTLAGEIIGVSDAAKIIEAACDYIRTVRAGFSSSR